MLYKAVPRIPPPEDGFDNDANAESAAFSSGEDLAEISKRNTHRRTEEIKDSLHFIRKSFILLVFVAFLLVGLCFIWHLITPAAWHFLSQPQMDTISTILFSGLVSGVAARYYESFFVG